MSEAQCLIFRFKIISETPLHCLFVPLKTRDWIGWPKTAQEGSKDLNVLFPVCQLNLLTSCKVSKRHIFFASHQMNLFFSHKFYSIAEKRAEYSPPTKASPVPNHAGGRLHIFSLVLQLLSSFATPPWSHGQASCLLWWWGSACLFLLIWWKAGVVIK